MKTTACFLLTAALAMTALHAADAPAADPFVRDAADSEAATQRPPSLVSVCVETFSLEMGEAAQLQRQKLSDTKLYAELLARVEKGEARQESFAVLRARSNEKATTESISEYIYPTEFDHGNPAPAAEKEDSTKPARPGAAIPALPTSYETRNVGFTLEMEPTISQDERIIDLRVAPDFTTLAERVKWGQGASEAEMPNFESQRLILATTLLPGQPQLLGTISRPPVSKVDPESAMRVWLCFVTADVMPLIKETE